MPTSLPYAVRHIRLDDSLVAPPLAELAQGSYVVFWWQEIALGHLFLAPGELLTEAGYHAALLTAITPAVQYYANQHSAGQEPWATWLAAMEYERWAEWMSTIMLGYLPIELPTQVPVSVVICTRNRAPQLRRCLLQLQALACAPAEIVVVDNAPSDTSTHDACQEFAGIVYLSEPRPGLDFARNTGIKATRYPVVDFVDDDVVMHPWLLYRVWETFQDPGVAAMTGLIIAMTLQSEAQIHFERYWSFNRGYTTKRYDAAFLHNSPAPPVWEIGAGANMAFRKAIFEEVGYFDELLGAGAAGCGDDSEMWFRILRHGHTVQYSPQAIVYHEHRRQLTTLKQQLFSYMRGHTVAALIQHAQQPQAGYANRIYRTLPQYYFRLLRVGFPFFRFRTRTLWSEITGVISGVAFYYRKRKRNSPPELS